MTYKTGIIISLLFFSSFYQLEAQTLTFNSIVSKTITNVDKADELIDKAWKFAKKCSDSPNVVEAVEYAKEAIRLSEEANEYANQAEKSADEAEQAFEKSGCFKAAAEADDAEDYCRHISYYSYEMRIYAKKAAAETDTGYMRNYISKVIHYAEDAYESVRNVKLELEEALKDWEACK